MRGPGRNQAAPRSRRQMIAMLTAGGAGVALIVVGLVLALTGPGPAADGDRQHRAARSTGRPAATGTPTRAANGGGQRDAVADRPMPSLPLSAATPGPVSTRDPGAPIRLPDCPRPGPAGVATGCPHTPEGAMAQLAALDAAAMQSGTMAGVREVIAAWAMPGGPTTTSWSGVSAMAQLLSSAGIADGAAAALVVTPMMGLFKGRVGPDFVVPCIDFEFDVTVARTARIGVSDCQRMVWTDGRWMIGPGAEPVQAPSVWPDTDAAMGAGYRDLRWSR